MSLLTESRLVLVFATSFSVLALLLWIDRHRLIGLVTNRNRLLVITLYIAIPFIVGVAILLWHQLYKDVYLPSSSTQDLADFSNNISLAIAALGLFFTIITGFMVTITRHCVDDVRRASEEQAKLHKERLAELDNRYKDKEIIFLLNQSKMAVIAGIANAENNDNLIGVASGPILNSKLNFLNEASHFRETNFSVYKFSECLERLVMVMENPAYQGILPKFFSHDDLDAFESLLSFLRTPVDGAAQYKYDQAAKALEPFVHRLGIIVG